jgi:cytochrome c-L
MKLLATTGLGATCLATALLIAPSLPWAQDDAQAPEGERLEFTHVLDDSPLDVYTPREGEEFTEAVEDFHVSAENPYVGDEVAIAKGEELFNRNCRACHGVEGAGGMGPSLSDNEVRRERAATQKGMFEIIYGGSAGAMQGFHGRLDQDDILHIMAYIETLGGAE